MKEKLSVVIPCYNAEKNIESVVRHDIDIFKSLDIVNFEFVLVNDYSKDGTWKILEKLSKEFDNIVAINLAKNCGQHGAIMAGFNHVSGDYVVVSDDDGQTQMEMIGVMLDKLSEGYDVVSADWSNRDKRSAIRKLGTKLTQKINNFLMDNPNEINLSIFFLARDYVIKEIVKYKNPYPYINGLVMRSTHNIAMVEISQLPRLNGTSGYSFKKLISLWLNGFTAFSIVPLRMASWFGIISAFIGFVYGIYVVVKKIVWGNSLAGWSSTVAIMLFMFGVTLCVLGMIGEYLGRIYMCINKSPQFVIKEIKNWRE